jgi:hypothetical protein
MMENNYRLFSNPYARFWQKYMGYDFTDKKTGRTLTKGEFYRKHTATAEATAFDEIELPARFELIPRAPFVPFVERHGKRSEKPQPIENIN